MPKWLPNNIWFWLISIVFSSGCIFLSYYITKLFYDPAGIAPKYFPFILIAPGGLGIATGNPEMPTLFFNSLLLLSVLRWRKWWLTIIFAMLAILTKPNALYMIPVLSVYMFSGFLKADTRLWHQTFIGIGAMLIGWLAWIMFVDLQTGEVGSYWQARMLFSKYVAGSPTRFFIELVNSFIYTGDIRDQIRYSTALLIPIMNIWLIGKISFSDETHRYALAGGILALLVVALLQGNPNKIIVYVTTLPGYFSIYLVMSQYCLNKEWLSSSINKLVIAPIYILFCIGMLFIYILGTPLGWYY